jgi:5-methylcytosine-specific restriction protein A
MNERYCARHIHEQPARKCFEKAERFNSQLYNTGRWKQLRKRIIKEQPYCFKCGAGVNDVTLEVHHRIPPKGNEELFFDEDNVICVCPSCHRILTGIEIAERKKG